MSIKLLLSLKRKLLKFEASRLALLVLLFEICSNMFHMSNLINCDVWHPRHLSSVPQTLAVIFLIVTFSWLFAFVVVVLDILLKSFLLLGNFSGKFDDYFNFWSCEFCFLKSRVSGLLHIWFRWRLRCDLFQWEQLYCFLRIPTGILAECKFIFILLQML